MKLPVPEPLVGLCSLYTPHSGRHKGSFQACFNPGYRSKWGTFYNELNTPYSSDWVLLLKLVLDHMYFANTPAHYLITDPSHLPQESLRFFATNANWMDALLDGALSVANHLEQDDDSIRTAIKTAINKYLDTILIDPILGFKLQIPTYGFFLRSGIVTRSPGLVVKAPRTDPDPRAPILQQENLTKDDMLVLFDWIPSDPDFATLSFIQPPHQQYFAVSPNVDADNFKIEYTKVYTTIVQPYGPARKDPLGDIEWKRNEAADPVFDWDSRMFVFPNYADNVPNYLKNNMPKGDVCSTFPCAALMGIQLNDLIYQMEIFIKDQTSPTPIKILEDRQEQPARTLKMLSRRPTQNWPKNRNKETRTKKAVTNHV